MESNMCCYVRRFPLQDSSGIFCERSAYFLFALPGADLVLGVFRSLTARRSPH